MEIVVSPTMAQPGSIIQVITVDPNAMRYTRGYFCSTDTRPSAKVTQQKTQWLDTTTQYRARSRDDIQCRTGQRVVSQIHTISESIMILSTVSATE